MRIRSLACIGASAFAVGLGGCGGSDDSPSTNATNPAPAEYPLSFNASFKPSAPLLVNYDFGRRTTILAAGTTYPPAALPLPCDITWDRDVPVTLRDGVVIYTDVLRPTGLSGQLPSIVAWSPYGKGLPTAPLASVPASRFSGIAKSEGADAAFWACNGYAVVNPDARGAYKSGGNIHFWGSVDAGDGYDVVEWIASQDWSNGKVGLHGTSWLAVAQWFIASTKPPHLAAIAPWNGFSDLYRDSVAVGGIPDIAFMGIVAGGLIGQNKTEFPADAFNSSSLMNAYWDDKSAKLEDITVPAYVTADGVTTLHRAGTLEGFRRLASKEKWLRINNTNEWFDQYALSSDRDLLKFFDHFLKGASNGWEQTARVRASVLDPGGTDKVDVPYTEWPIPNTSYEKLYLDASNGSLNLSAPGAQATATYDGKSGQTTFTIAFAQDTQLTGYLKAHLFVSSDTATDMDLFVLVEKLAADGTVLVASPTFANAYFPIPPTGTPGRLRASLRALDPALSTDYHPVGTFRNPQRLLPGQVVPVDIAIQPEAMLWHAGEKLRLTVAGAPIKEQLPVPTLNVGNHLIHTGGEFPSYLQVPSVSVAK